MYLQVKDENNEVVGVRVHTDTTEFYVPNNPELGAWIDYQKWLAAGNTPLDYTQPVSE